MKTELPAARAPLPKFRSDEAVAEYFDTHSVAEVWNRLPEGKPAKPSKALANSIRKRHAAAKSPISIRLGPEQIAAAKKIAAAKSVGYQSQLRMWIAEGIRREAKRAHGGRARRSRFPSYTHACYHVSGAFRAPPCPRKGLRPSEIAVSSNRIAELFSAQASGHRAQQKGAHVSRTLPTRRMHEHPDLDQLKRQAKELLRAFLAVEPEATVEVHAHYTRPDRTTFALHDAQLVLARSYGFESWPKLKAYVNGVTVRRLADTVRANDLARAHRMLETRPELANMAMSYGDEHRPIHFAVMNRLPEMVRLLMQHGANARAGIDPHRDATTAWMLARDRGYDELIAVIEDEERHQKPPEVEEQQETRGDEDLRAAVAEGNIEWLRARHAAGTLTNPIRWDGGGLLTVAVEHSRPDILTFLLDCGFDPNERVSEGEGDWIAYSQGYPLWTSAALGRRNLAEILLARGADPNVHVDSSGSPVHSAYSHKQWEMVDLLRNHGGEVTADTAAIYRQTGLVREMLASGKADPAEILRFGAMGGDPEIVRMILDRIDWPRDDPHWFRILTEPLYFWHHIPWLYAGNKEFDRGTYLTCFKLILKRCGPNVTGSFGRTPLHEVAAMRDHITEDETGAFAEALLNAGAKVGGRDDLLKSTALGWACRWGHVRVAKLMLEHGADPVEGDAERWARPRAWAEKRAHAEIIELLGRYGG